ncbi:MAG TPA: DUF916 domain-containing protein [Verrucomicrobiae bacterium]|nr:DUF916 domain-containing protein [Verrucomicrobiae bacterium]
MRKTFKKIATAILVAIAFGLFPQPASADSITVSPPRFELFGNPGDVISEKIKIKNDSDTEVTYQVEVEDFVAQGDEGSVGFVDPSTSNETFSLARWVTFEPSKFTVPPAQERVISYTIRIPRNSEAGGHYGSVLVKRAGTAAPGAASVDSRVGSLILLRVSGNITEKLSLESFRTENSFQQYGPVDLHMRYKNEGNVHVAPTGTIVITNIFGKKVKEIVITPTNILPDASRVVTANWDTKNLVGQYTASLVVNYGQGKQALAGSTSFIVFPLYLLVVLVGVILAIYLLITKRKAVKRLINNLTRD